MISSSKLTLGTLTNCEKDRNGRYLYELQSSPSEGVKAVDDDERSSYCTCLSYQLLSGNKSFDALFFREKQNILKIVDHVHQKSGQYAVHGYPHKLGLLKKL